MLDMLTSTSGVLLEKDNVNDACCLTENLTDACCLKGLINAVKSDGGCVGGGNNTFQQWVDYTASTYGSSDPLGLCFENWHYVLKGILR